MVRIWISLLAILSILGLAGCKSQPYSMPYTPTAELPPPDPNMELMNALGMGRQPADLGFDEKTFNPCSFGLSGSTCRNRYFSVVHFQLLCRDSEGTVSVVPVSLQPIVANEVKWEVAGVSGGTQTDTNGYGQFTVVSDRSTKNQRLKLRIGPQYVAFNVSEVSKIVLPKNFCRTDRVAAAD